MKSDILVLVHQDMDPHYADSADRNLKYKMLQKLCQYSILLSTSRRNTALANADKSGEVQNSHQGQCITVLVGMKHILRKFQLTKSFSQAIFLLRKYPPPLPPCNLTWEVYLGFLKYCSEVVFKQTFKLFSKCICWIRIYTYNFSLQVYHSCQIDSYGVEPSYVFCQEL